MTYVNGGSVLAVAILFILLAIAAVIARFNIRRQKSGLGIDDWLCLPALALVIAEGTIMIIGSVTHTVGYHSPPNLGPEIAFYDGSDQILLEKLEFPFDLMQILALATIKLSILFFYRRIFRGRAFDIASWVLIGVVGAWVITFIIAILAACGTSIAANFQTLGALKRDCVDTFDILIALAVSDVAVDLAILIMPVPLVLALQMPMRRKVAVLVILLVGTLAIACGITRMALFGVILGPALFSHAEVGGVPSDDDVGIVSILMFWGMLEVGIAMIAACLPVLRPLFQGWSPESIIRSFRSQISLRSSGSGNKASHNAKGSAKRTESETAITGVPYTGKSGHNTLVSIDVEAYAMGRVSGGEKYETLERGPGRIWRETELKQTSEII